jgi:hypothetical protein
MSLGLNLNENVKVVLGENREQLLEKLKKEEIRHKVMYDKPDDNGVLETVINIGEYDIEIQLWNNIIGAVRAYNNTYTNIYKSGERYGTPSKFLARVQGKIKEMCEDEDVHIDIEKIDLGTMQCRFIVNQNGSIYKISTTRDAHSNIYIGNLRLLKDQEEAS